MDKSPEAFRTISEVAEDLDLPQHVLRFWETRFAQIKPLKRGGGRRYYRPDDVDLLKGIRFYLYGEGYTIKGVQRILKDRGIRHVSEMGRAQTENYAPPVAVIPTAEDETKRRERQDWPEAVALPHHNGSDHDDDEDADDTPFAVALREDDRAPGPSILAGSRLSERAEAALQGLLHDLIECRRLLQDAQGR